MRYIEVVGGLGVWRVELNEGEPVTGYTGFGTEVLEIGEFTRENVAKFLEIRGGPGDFPIQDFHAVCDDIDIPWATKDGFDCYQASMVARKLKH